MISELEGGHFVRELSKFYVHRFEAPILFPDPIALVDPTVNLEAVVVAKRIGDAMKMLCTRIPGKLSP